jgi:hypothetical protein
MAIRRALRILRSRVWLLGYALREAGHRFRVVWSDTSVACSHDNGVTWTLVRARDFEARYGLPLDLDWLNPPKAKLLFATPSPDLAARLRAAGIPVLPPGADT